MNEDVKQRIRERTWRALQDARVAAFPGARGRIPNFTGAPKARDLLADLSVWKSAQVIKCNPDSPQRPVRRRALEEGKVVYMPVPRLTDSRCFIELDPRAIDDYAAASSIKGAFSLGRPVHPREMGPVDLIVCGAVAVGEDGSRLGKGGGYSDLEYALLLTLGLAGPETPIVTTVHPLQVSAEAIPMTTHDIVLDFFVTPEEVVKCRGAYDRPQGVLWDQVGQKMEEIPILREIKEQAPETV